jgi:starch phosphorylase
VRAFFLYVRPSSRFSVTPRRWLDQCNPGLSKLITDTLKLPKTTWLKDLTKLQGLLAHTEDATFRKKWAAVKQSNKERLAAYVEETLGTKVNTQALFDVQIKRLHEYKRQTLSVCSFLEFARLLKQGGRYLWCHPRALHTIAQRT